MKVVSSACDMTLYSIYMFEKLVGRLSLIAQAKTRGRLVTIACPT